MKPPMMRRKKPRKKPRPSYIFKIKDWMRAHGLAKKQVAPTACGYKTTDCGERRFVANGHSYVQL